MWTQMTRAAAYEAAAIAALVLGQVGGQLYDVLSPSILALPWAGAGAFAAFTRISWGIVQGVPAPSGVRATSVVVMSMFVGVTSGTVASAVILRVSDNLDPLRTFPWEQPTIMGAVLLLALLSDEVISALVAIGGWASAQAVPAVRRWVSRKIGVDDDG